jgi:hypothetical protein
MAVAEEDAVEAVDVEVDAAEDVEADAEEADMARNERKFEAVKDIASTFAKRKSH